MSSIAGAVDFNGLRDGAGQLERIGRAGFGGTNRPWLDKFSGLVSAPGQPFHNIEAGLVLVMDGRLDGVRELASACTAAGHRPQGETAPELVMRAYQTWGDGCPLHILGEYAFAIWDQTRQRLFCARDSGGIRPLFYAVLPNGSFRFGTNALQILTGTDASRMFDEAGLVDFLISRSALLPDRSPWRSVQRLGAAHALALDGSGLRVWRYWSVYETPTVRFSNQDEAVRACSAAFQAAIRDRVEGAGRAGISLSGGWDSGAAFVVWQWMRQQGPSLPEPWFYTYYYDSPEGDERAEVCDLLRCWPATGEFVHLDAGGVLDGLGRHCMELGMPEPASGWGWVAACAAAARAAGVARVLVGEAGNEVLQSSILRPADLLRSGRAREAYRQLTAWGRDAEVSTRSFVWPFVIRPALAASFPGIWDVARNARGLFRMPSGALPYLTDSSRDLAQDLISQAHARKREQLKGRTISSWDKRASLERWCSELFPIPAGPELEGVALTVPYLDRRVVTSALAALDCESSTGSTRQLLADTVRHITGRPFRGRHAHYTGLLEMALRGALQTGSGLFSASRLVELRVVDPVGLKGFVECFRSGNGASLTSLWRLISAEVWARLFIT